MTREGSLLKNTFILSLGSYLPKLTALITLPLLTGYLTKLEYGLYDLITTLVALLLPALTLQIQSAAFRFLVSCRDSTENKKKIISNIFAFTMPISIIGLSVTFFFLHNIDVNTRIYILCYFFLDIIYVSCGQISRGLGKNLSFAFAAVINSIINMIGFSITLLIFDGGLNGIIISMMIGCLCGVIWLFFTSKIYLYISPKAISITQIKSMLKYSWPMVPNALSNWVLSLSDRLVIVNFIGIEANAIYAVANKIPNLVKTFQGNFTSAWQENASLSINDNDKTEYYSRMFDNINRIVLGFVAIMIAVTPILFKIFIKGDYDSAYKQISLLFIGVYFACMAQFMGGIYIAYLKTKSVGITTLCAALCNLIIDLLAVNYWGLYAASVSTLISYMFLFIFRLIDCQKFQHIKINYIKTILCFSFIILMSILNIKNVFWINIINGVLGFLFAFFVNRRLIMIIIKKIKIHKRSS